MKQIDALKKKNRLSVQELCLFSLYGALIFALKMIMAPLPNIEPVTLLILLDGCVFGWKGIWALAVYVGCELLMWGIGPWSAAYLYIWLIPFITGIVFRPVGSPLFWAFAGALFGFAFGALCALPMLLIGGWQSALAWWQAGVLFDLIHGTGNFFVILLLWKPLRLFFFHLLQKRKMV